MASGSDSQKSSGSGTTGTATGPFSWDGAKSPSTFDPKSFGTTIFNDANTAFKQGPVVNPVNPFTDYTDQTKGLISGGLNQVAANGSATGPLATYASGKYLDGSDDPYFEANLANTRNNVTADTNSTFNSNGRFGSDIHAEGLGTALANTENQAREANLSDEWNKMLQAQGGLQTNTANGLGLSGLLDSKAAEKTAADATMWDRTNNSAYNHIAQYLGLLNNSGGAQAPTNKPASIWDILGTVGSTAAAFL